MNKEPVIGVLALQGAVQPHKKHIEAAGGVFRAVKTPAQFQEVDAFILPGGESSTMLKLIERFSLWESLVNHFSAKPVWGICAGCILMARNVSNPQQKAFGLLPIDVERNGYGRQLESHYLMLGEYKVSFIRAPIIQNAQADVEVLASDHDNPVWVKKEQYMATTFHPELSFDAPSPMHKTFMQMVHDHRAAQAA